MISVDNRDSEKYSDKRTYLPPRKEATKSSERRRNETSAEIEKLVSSGSYTSFGFPSGTGSSSLPNRPELGHPFPEHEHEDSDVDSDDPDCSWNWINRRRLVLIRVNLGFKLRLQAQASSSSPTSLVSTLVSNPGFIVVPVSLFPSQTQASPSLSPPRLCRSQPQIQAS